MIVLNLSVENWIGNRNQSCLIDNPTWQQIEKAILELDGKTKTLVTLGIDDDTYMSIGGGFCAKYIVNATFDNISFQNLVDLSKSQAIEKLVVGGQEGNYSTQMCIELQVALLAAKTFAESGELDRSLSWEEEKSLVSI
ncbi:Imm1 family immunity protein [Phormidium nigroviride]